MKRDLTSSTVDRQNILNNQYALQKIEGELKLPTITFEGQHYMMKAQVAELFETSERTIERYLEKYEEELKANGYVLITGKTLNNLRLDVAPDIDVGSKTTQLGLFQVRTILNLAMLLVESEPAKHMRTKMLDIVLDTLAERTGGERRYINQRDQEYLPAALLDKTYRKDFTAALNDCVNMNQYKYARYTNLVYQAIFEENAREYRQILRLSQRETVRETLYAEVLRVIASVETGFASELYKRKKVLQRKLTQREADELFDEFTSHPLWVPQILDARTKMASRDLHFRDAYHKKLSSYIEAIPPDDFERFLGETSKALEARLKDAKDVFKRLKDR